MFQSTHSLRSATSPAGNVETVMEVSIHALLAECDFLVFLGFKLFHVVSIHALLAECDVKSSKGATPGQRFNPRTPCGVRLSGGGNVETVMEVSIHALLAECDIPPGLGSSGGRSFNPRTPCGVRPNPSYRTHLNFWFQSTHSLRSATRIQPLKDYR